MVGERSAVVLVMVLAIVVAGEGGFSKASGQVNGRHALLSRKLWDESNEQHRLVDNEIEMMAETCQVVTFPDAVYREISTDL